jgi:plasmid stability protein
MDKESLVFVGVKLPDRLDREIKARAALAGISKQDFVRDLLTVGLKEVSDVRAN